MILLQKNYLKVIKFLKIIGNNLSLNEEENISEGSILDNEIEKVKKFKAEKLKENYKNKINEENELETDNYKKMNLMKSNFLY